MTADLEATVRELEARVRLLEDRLEIARLMATYGPAVDSGSSTVTGALWADDGVYDSGVGTWTGPDGIGGMVQGEMHQSIIHGGSAHVISAPLITIDGDTAVSICYAQLLRWDGDAFRVWRTTANRWEWRREPDGWRITYRVNRMLDGSEEPRELFRRGVERQ
jgi:hypothetical protein